MTDQLSEAFEICLVAIHGGSSLEDCLALYPHLASELEPLLSIALLARQLQPKRVPASALRRSRASFLKQARAFEHKPAWSLPAWSVPRLAIATFSLLLVIFLSLNGLVVASAQTLPGDTLYAVKRAAETVRLQLASDTEVKHRMENDYILRRAAEVKKLLALQRTTHITLEGRVDQIQDQHWIVEGVPVSLDADTILIGNIVPGDFIEVEGVTNPSGWVDADELHQRYFNLVGVVQSIGRKSWTVAGVQLVIQKDTQFDPGLQIGDQALVLVFSSDDSNLYARAILNYRPAPVQPVDIQLTGYLESIDGQVLTIDGKRVTVNPQTIIEGNLVPGMLVSIVSRVNQDGSLTALSVKVLNDPSQKPASDAGEDDGGEADESGDDDQEEIEQDDDADGDDLEDDPGDGEDDGDDGDGEDDGDDDDGEDDGDDDDGEDDGDDDDDGEDDGDDGDGEDDGDKGDDVDDEEREDGEEDHHSD